VREKEKVVATRHKWLVQEDLAKLLLLTTRIDVLYLDGKQVEAGRQPRQDASEVGIGCLVLSVENVDGLLGGDQ